MTTNPPRMPAWENYRKQSAVNPALVEAMGAPSDLPTPPAKPLPERPALTLRNRHQVSPSQLLARAQQLVREAYDAMQSAGSLLLTASATARDDYDRKSIELCRDVLRDASADVSVAAYILPRNYTPALDRCIKSELPIVANGHHAN